MKTLIPQIPMPTSDQNSILAAVKVIRSNVETLALNAAGHPDSQIFALAGAEGQTAALAAASSSGADATVQFNLDDVAGALIMFSYTNIAASAAGTLIVAVDGADLVSVPLAISGGNAFPLTSFTFIGNLGVGPHTASVRASTGITGFAIAVVGSKR